MFHVDDSFHQPVAHLQSLAGAVDGVVAQLQLVQLVHVGQLQRQVGDVVVLQVQHLQMLRQFPQLVRGELIMLEVQPLEALAEVTQILQLVMRQIGGGELRQLV